MSEQSLKGMKDKLKSELEKHLLLSVPRILTQLDRDPDSPTFGSFDRHFWHYKMRDFSSIVLQQGMVTLQALYSAPAGSYSGRADLKIWVDASIRFWASQQLSCGGFNEYYPFEDGFPPTAFSLHAVALVFQQRGFPSPEKDLLQAIQRAADRLLRVQELGAYNQEATALAALTLAAQIPGIIIDKKQLAGRFADFFASQSIEGWFPEYGGADIGYLSVTIDALFGYFELSGDIRAEIAMKRALKFISSLISVSGETPVMINSRNTDYLAPYGLIRMAQNDPLARRVVESILDLSAAKFHFLQATDDRYLCHYLYHSCYRGVEHLPAMTDEKALLPCEEGADIFYPEAGLHILHLAGSRSIFTAARKGGVFYLYTPKGLLFADYGWRQRVSSGKFALTHWQNPENCCQYVKGRGECIIEASGQVSIHGWIESSPLRHFALRCASLLLGSRIIALLKRIMIFSAAKTGINYCRTIRISNSMVNIVDSFSGTGIESFNPTPAPPYSLRHVASAANFASEELSGFAPLTRVTEKTPQTLTISANIILPESGV